MIECYQKVPRMVLVVTDAVEPALLPQISSVYEDTRVGVASLQDLLVVLNRCVVETGA